MKSPLLNTKLHIPTLQVGLVERARLTNQIGSGLSRKLTLISSPAGSGKSTLMGVWAKQHLGSISWLSLDENDNDLKRFLTYFVSAIQIQYPECGNDLLAVLKSPSLPPFDRILAIIINDLALSAKKLVIILDDYQVIEQTTIHKAVLFFVSHLPKNIHLIIATRNDPPFPLPKLRANGELNEIRAADLRFTKEETKELLNSILPTTLSERDLLTIEGRMEGWVVGLKLVGLALKDRKDASRFISEFSGSHRYIIDYLSDEVFKQLPKDILDFMQSISLLKQFNADLCNAVTGRNDSAKMIDFLETENLFIVSLDDQRQWYRFHHLFRDLLFHKLRQNRNISLNQLHRLALDWYEENELIPDALRHAFGLEDFDRAADLLENQASTMIGQGETHALQKWIEKIPEVILKQHPKLWISLAWVYNLNNQGEPLEPLLRMAEEALISQEYDAQSKNEISGNAAILRAYTSLAENQPQKALQQMETALNLLPEDNIYLRSIASFTQGVVYKRGFVWKPAERTLTDAYESGQNAGNFTLAMASIIHLIEMYIMQGRLHEAAELCLKVIERHHNQYPIPNLGFVYTKLAEIQYEWDRLELAADNLEMGFSLIEKMFADIGWTRDARICLMQVKQTQGNPDAARAALNRAIQINEHMQDIHDKVDLSFWQARLWLIQGDHTSAMRWQREYQDQTKKRSEQIDVTLAKILIAQEEGQQALELLRPLSKAAKETGRFAALIEMLCLQAQAYHLEKDIVSACTTLKEALSYAEPEGFVRVFIDVGLPIAELLQLIKQKPEELSTEEDFLVSEKYLAQLIAAFPSRSFPESPLNERELEVFCLLAAGKKTPEIASELFLSNNTVKWYLKNIYSKLNVHSRADAIEQGRRLELIS